MPNIRWLGVFLSLWFWAVGFVAMRQSSLAQEPQTDTVRIRTELVQIDVTVKDRQGKPVLDLRREDFEVLEDGKPQTLTHFAVGTANRPATYLVREPEGRGPRTTATSVPAVPTASGRYIVLAVDDYHLVAENLAAVKSTLQQFIERDVTADDQVALLATSGALGLYQQFTTDRAAVQRAINRLSLQDRTSSHLGGVPYISAYQAELIEENDPGAVQIAAEELAQRRGKTPVQGRGAPTPLSSRNTNPDDALVRSKARTIVTENARYTALTLSSLENAMRGLRQLPGRKIMVLLSDGFFTRNLREFSAYDLRRISDAATRAGVVIYTVDARGLVAKPTLGSAADPQSSTATSAPDARRRIVQGEINAKLEGLFALAKDTGGQPYFNNNDLNAGLKRVLEDTESYYVLAYEPINQTRDGRFRKIEVRLANHPEARIQTRAGYFAPTEEATVAHKDKPKEKSGKPSAQPSGQEAAAAKLNQYRAALNSLVPLRGIPVTMGAHFVHVPPGGSRAIIMAQFDAAQLGLMGNTTSTVLEVFGVVLDESGNAVKSFNHSFDFKSNAQGTAKPLNYHNVLPLEPGLYHVRLAVADSAMTQVGTQSAWLEIPALKPAALALSSLFIAAEGKELAEIYEAFGATMGAGSPGAKPLEPVPQFKRGVNLDFLLFAYNAQLNAQGTGGLLIQIKLLNGGKVIYSSPPNEMPMNKELAEQGAPVVARVPLDSYEPGAYELQLEITDQITHQTARRSSAFTIE